MLPIEPLIIKHLCHLAIDPAQLGVVEILNGGVGAVDGVVVALESHGGIAVLVVGTAQQVMGQQTVIISAVVIKETDVVLNLLYGEGLVSAIPLVKTIEAGTHAVTVGFSGAAAER